MVQRIVILKPCCIGDVILTTPLLCALRRAYSDSTIDWIVGSSAIAALRDHPALNSVINSGPLANPASRPASFLRLVQHLRSGKYDLAIVPDRSPLPGIATLLVRIPQRAGLDSGGRGFTYTVKARIDPNAVRHEAEIYLDVARALGIPAENCWANVPPSAQGLDEARRILAENGLAGERFIVVHPGGGVNAGMTMIEKRWPAARFAALAERASEALNAQIVVIGLKTDQEAIETFKERLGRPIVELIGKLTLAGTGALASLAAVYLGNDNGVAHLAAASGGKVLMIFGPSDPRRYAPFVPADRARIAWRPIALPERGVSAGIPKTFSWERDGVSVEEAWEALKPLL